MSSRQDEGSHQRKQAPSLGVGNFSRIHFVVALLLFALAVQGPLRLSRHLSSDGKDLRTILAGAACLHEGCSPYDTVALNRMFVEHGAPERSADKWLLQLPIYPPQSIALFVPLSFVSMSRALFLNWVITWIVLLGSFGAVMLRSRTFQTVPPVLRVLLLAPFFVMSRFNLANSNGNPAIPVIALLLFAVAEFSEGYAWLRMVALGVAILLKPQLALPFVLVLIVRSPQERRRLLWLGAALVAYSAAVWAWCMTHPALKTWLPDLKRELALGSAGANSMNPAQRITVFDSLVNLDFLVGYFIPSPHVRAVVVAVLLLAATSLMLFAAYRLWASRRVSEHAMTALLTAVVCSWTLLPVYHRFYDALLSVLAAAWVGIALTRWRTALQGFVVAVLAYLTIAWPTWLSRHMRTLEGVPGPRSIYDFLGRRYNALATALLFAVTLFLLFRQLRQRPAADNRLGDATRAVHLDLQMSDV